MTKTLTEQWRDGTLDGGYYYLKMKDGNVFIDHTEYIFWSHEIRWETKDSSYIKEVLSPVPNYEEYNKLRKLPLKCFQLEEYNSALVVINKDMCKEIERLQEQLKEANKLIKDFHEMHKFNKSVIEYLEKWGVK